MMRHHYALIGLREGIGLLLLVFTTSGCASYIAMEAPQTLPEGQINLVFAGVRAEDDNETRGFGVLKGRVGGKNSVDIGARLDVPFFSVMVDAKYQLLHTDKHGLDLAFLGGTGLPSLFHFQTILGRQLGPLQIYSSYRFQLFGVPHLGGDLLSNDDLEVFIHQGFAGLRLELTKNLFCQGEGGYTWDYSWEREIYMIGVGCGTIFSAL